MAAKEMRDKRHQNVKLLNIEAIVAQPVRQFVARRVLAQVALEAKLKLLYQRMSQLHVRSSVEVAV